MPKQTIEQALSEHASQWMVIPGVVGTAIGLIDGSPCILILSSAKASELRDKIPSTVQGHPVVIQETGTFHALNEQ